MVRKTNTKTLIEAMRILARDIQSDDGVANGVISEAADRMEELQAQHRKDDDEYAKLWQMYGDLEAERDRYKKALTILDTWEFSGRMGKREMKNIVSEALQEDKNE